MWDSRPRGFSLFRAWGAFLAWVVALVPAVSPRFGPSRGPRYALRELSSDVAYAARESLRRAAESAFASSRGMVLEVHREWWERELRLGVSRSSFLCLPQEHVLLVRSVLEHRRARAKSAALGIVWLGCVAGAVGMSLRILDSAAALAVFAAGVAAAALARALLGELSYLVQSVRADNSLLSVGQSCPMLAWPLYLEVCGPVLGWPARVVADLSRPSALAEASCLAQRLASEVECSAEFRDLSGAAAETFSVLLADGFDGSVRDLLRTARLLECSI